MKRFLLIVAVLAICSQASAEWRYRKVCTTVQVPVQVKVYPQPVWQTCSMGHQHLVQPEPYWEQQKESRAEWHWEKYWAPDPVIYYSTVPVYSSEIYYSTVPVYSAPVYYYP